MNPLQPFDDILTTVVRSAGLPPRTLAPGECQSPSGQRCTLCHAIALDYQSELRLKKEALERFWKTLRVSCPLEPLVPSPLGRNYRTTTKRRVFPYRDSVRLGLINPGEEGEVKPFPVVQCAIEPEAHCAIYNQIQESIVKPYARKLAKRLSYVVIKGNYNEQTLILNVRDLSSEVVRAANTLSKSLTRLFSTITGVFLYEDVSSPQYYLGSGGRKSRIAFRKLFGKGEIFHRVEGRSFLFSPLSFSQVNHAMLEKMIQAARTFLKPTKELRLFDLYCGYGLFALSLAEECRDVVGAEVSPASIASAVANARRQKVSNVRFLLTDINEETVERIMHSARPGDLVLLDPPRKGTAEGVIERIASYHPARVVHIVCAIDLLSQELKRWQRSGYKPIRAMPLDMFPGTSAVETMLLLEATERFR